MRHAARLTLILIDLHNDEPARRWRLKSSCPRQPAPQINPAPAPGASVQIEQMFFACEIPGGTHPQIFPPRNFSQFPLCQSSLSGNSRGWLATFTGVHICRLSPCTFVVQWSCLRGRERHSFLVCKTRVHPCGLQALYTQEALS